MRSAGLLLSRLCTICEKHEKSTLETSGVTCSSRKSKPGRNKMSLRIAQRSLKCEPLVNTSAPGAAGLQRSRQEPQSWTAPPLHGPTWTPDRGLTDASGAPRHQVSRAGSQPQLTKQLNRPGYDHTAFPLQLRSLQLADDASTAIYPFPPNPMAQ